jgi:hypothetical protein
MVNVLKTKDPASLISNIMYSNSENKPTILGGAPGCIDFRGKGDARVGVCLSNNDEAKEIITAYESFYKCQSGRAERVIKVTNITCADSEKQVSVT